MRIPTVTKPFPTEHLDSVLPRVDDLLLACPLTERTRNLLSRERIALLRRSPCHYIARSPVWDQEAVCDALDVEHLESAFTTSPFPNRWIAATVYGEPAA